MSSIDPWAASALALRLIATDPALGGLHLRARAGPVRDKVLTLMREICGNVGQLHPQIEDEALFGGLDISATLQSGRPVKREGLLARHPLLLCPMAERLPTALAGRLAQQIDTGNTALILLDEGVDAEETIPAALAERLAFRIDLDALSMRDVADRPTLPDWDGETLDWGDAVQAIAATCSAFGIDSGRAPLLALRCLRSLSELAPKQTLTERQMEVASILTLAHRATQLPSESTSEPPPPETAAPDAPDSTGQLQDIPDEILLDAVRAHLPDDLLVALTARGKMARGSGAGGRITGNRRGRPLPARSGHPGGQRRLDLVATLRQAAPWQGLRGRADPTHPIRLRTSDFRIKRYELCSDRLLVFAVDASGSAALARLAEAKGAVELLLAQAYARRDHVSLIAFRGTGAETLLPPTRSLVQAKRRLADLAGGGGTPLATGLFAAFTEAETAQRRGLTPMICVLTDGKANIARDGTANRAQAGADADSMARLIRAAEIDTLVIDIGRRSERRLATLAQIMDARYLVQPRADAKSLSDAVSTAMG